MDTLKIGFSDFNRFYLLNPYNLDLSIFNYSDGSNSILGQFLFQDNKYFVEFKMIPKYTGHYMLQIGSDISFNGKNQSFEGKCPNVIIDAKAYTNNKGDNNIQIVNESLNESYKDYLTNTDSRFKDKGGYCFRVIE